MIQKYFQEKYRPLFHYSAQSNIINDPNGLVWYEGEYHLFHQYNVNNHIHWGHAVSNDLTHWRHLPPALFPDSIGQIWSGSVVVDIQNSAGFQHGKEPAMVAIFTYNEHVDAQQSQGIAYSTDRGHTWNMYTQNPVLTGRGQKDFRDPKVFWDVHRKRWSMVIACGDHVEFYASSDLKKWDFTREFGKGIWEGTWECPDLFEILVEGEKKTIWILITSMNNGSPAGGTGTRYFLGEYDGVSFTPVDENSPWLDMGKDFYAGVTWNNIPEVDSRRLMIGWADNWRYRDNLPTTPFLGQFSCVREISVVRKNGKLCLIQKPNRELVNLRRQQWKYANLTVSMQQPIQLNEIKEKALDIYLSGYGNEKSIFELKINIGKKFVVVGIDFKEAKLYIDRRGSSDLNLIDYQERYEANLKYQSDFPLHILLDQSQLEVFADDGSIVMTCLLFPDTEEYTLELCCVTGDILLRNTEIYKMDSVWREEAVLYDKYPLSIISGQWAHTVSGIEGYSKNTGITLLPDLQNKKTWSVKIKITDYGEDAKAGILIDKDMIAFLDGNENKLIVSRNHQIIAEYSTKVNRGRVYNLGMVEKQNRLSILLDEIPVLFVDHLTPEKITPGLYVDNTFVYFNI